MTAHSHAATQRECAVCGGPCREPYRQNPVPENYPFMTPEAIEATRPVHGPPAPPGARRAHRKGEDRMRRPETHPRGGENR